MIIRLYEAGQEIKSYNSFDSLELIAVMKDSVLNSKYELKFYGNKIDMIKSILNLYSNDNCYLKLWDLNSNLILDDVKCNKYDASSQIFNFIDVNRFDCDIQMFEGMLNITFEKLNIKYSLWLID